ncbi:ABC transporter ATP-binding protein [Bacillus halotolerans]|uniref:ABC transporter ATP-binding protein n=1 Tax=Bacillus halotolerans TaxID=260554 RepID=UPI00187AC67E|nr:ABC transporter ATP-binding protein [Bacillus halotolerans]MEC1543701.1 ABC transporter ATP-binding protein [Bacillus halotolerans]
MIIETKGVTKTYNHVDVVNEVDMLVPEGEIYGFLGPNGSGKTTMMRMLLGLVRPNRGSIRMFGKKMPDDRISILAKTGALIEKPSYYDHLDARDNLRVLAALRGIDDNRIIDRALERVSLHRAGRKKVKSYSLGMKQRLGIASAMLHNPRILLLDEPTNGLDPEGIYEIRELIHNLSRKEGVTVLISSHLLGEVEQAASRIGIIYNGNLLFQGKMNELLTHQKMDSCVIESSMSRLIIDVLHTNDIQTILDREGKIHVRGMEADKDRIKKILTERGLTNFHIYNSMGTLEDAYLELIRSYKVSV